MLPVNRGITGKIKKKTFRKYLNNIVGNHDIEEIQKTVTVSNVHLLRTALMQMFTTFIKRNNIMCTIKYNRGITATLLHLFT